MILKMYSVYDKLTGYMNPVCQPNDDVAIRSFSRDINSSEMSLISANVDDFNLQCVGSFDTETGVITSCNPVIIVDAGSLKRKE